VVLVLVEGNLQNPKHQLDLIILSKNRFDKLEKEVTNLRNDFNRVVKLNNLKH